MNAILKIFLLFLAFHSSSLFSLDRNVSERTRILRYVRIMRELYPNEYPNRLGSFFESIASRMKKIKPDPELHINEEDVRIIRGLTDEQILAAKFWFVYMEASKDRASKIVPGSDDLLEILHRGMKKNIRAILSEGHYGYVRYFLASITYLTKISSDNASWDLSRSVMLQLRFLDELTSQIFVQLNKNGDLSYYSVDIDNKKNSFANDFSGEMHALTSQYADLVLTDGIDPFIQDQVQLSFIRFLSKKAGGFSKAIDVNLASGFDESICGDGEISAAWRKSVANFARKQLIAPELCQGLFEGSKLLQATEFISAVACSVVDLKKPWWKRIWR